MSSEKQEKDLIAIEGIVDSTFRAIDKETGQVKENAPFTVTIQTKTKKEIIKIWPGALLDKVDKKIFEGDHIYVTVPEGEKDDYQSKRLKQEIYAYNLKNTSLLIINQETLLSPENKLVENVTNEKTITKKNSSSKISLQSAKRVSVRIQSGKTLNMGNFNSAKIDVAIEVIEIPGKDLELYKNEIKDQLQIWLTEWEKEQKGP